MKKINLEKVAELYSSGLNDADIAKKLNISSISVFNYRKKNKLPKNPKYKKIFDTELYEKLHKEGLSDLKISKLLNISDDCLARYRKENKLLCNMKQYLYIPTKEEFEVLIGTLLGDSSLNKRKNKTSNVNGSFAHSLHQKEYAIYKYNKLKNLCTEKESINYVKDKRNNKIYSNIRFTFKANRFLTKLYPFIYNDVKYINSSILKRFSELSLAILYYDDGYKNENGGYYISTQCFSKEDLIKFQDFLLKKWNIISAIHKSNILYITKQSSVIFTNLISKYATSDVKYKLHVLTKQEELLEHPTLERQKEDNQQPSLDSNISEGSTTNTQDQTSNVEVSNGNTSILPSTKSEMYKDIWDFYRSDDIV